MWDSIKKKCLTFLQSRRTWLKNLAFLFSFVSPALILYIFYSSSFQVTWKGRALYLFFLWLAFLGFTLSWNELSSISSDRSGWSRTLISAAFLLVPTVYALAIFYTELYQLVTGLGKFLNVPFGGLEQSWPMSVEYVLLATCFSAAILFIYGSKGLRKLSAALFFIWAVAVFYTIDTFFPFGTVWILQIFVPITANSSATILNWMGYKAITSPFNSPIYGPGTLLVVLADKSAFSALVFWPSAGVHSMFIYTFTIFLFIKGARIPLTKNVAIFAIGAAGTFMANILRIVTIFIMGLNIGRDAAIHFHDYYGEFFFISWMLIYLTIIFLARKMLQKAV